MCHRQAKEKKKNQNQINTIGSKWDLPFWEGGNNIKATSETKENQIRERTAHFSSGRKASTSATKDHQGQFPSALTI